MKHFDKGTLVTAFVVLLTLLQAGLAGMAVVERRAAEREVQVERATTFSYATQLAAARPTDVDPSAQHPTLLPTADVAGTLKAIQAVSDRSGITSVSAKAVQSSTAGRQSFLITGRGKPEQVCALIAGLEQHERLIVVENGKFSPGTDDELSFEFGLATYHSGGGK